jgi:hypothetical protein
VISNKTVGVGSGASIVGKGRVWLCRLAGQEAHRIRPRDNASTINASHNLNALRFFIIFIIPILALFCLSN